MLVGSDHYWDFITGNVIKSEDGPVAVESVFGWILSGVSESNDSNHFDNCNSVFFKKVLGFQNRKIVYTCY